MRVPLPSPRADKIHAARGYWIIGRRRLMAQSIGSLGYMPPPLSFYESPTDRVIEQASSPAPTAKGPLSMCNPE